MTRALKTATLDGAAKYYASEFLRDSGERDRAWVMGQFFKFGFKDEFDYLVEAMREEFGGKARADFDARYDKLEKRTDEVFASWLAVKLAIDPQGSHIKGKIGKVKVNGRLIGTHIVEVENYESMLRRRRLGLDKSHRHTEHQITKLVWPIYAGESETPTEPPEMDTDFQVGAGYCRKYNHAR